MVSKSFIRSILDEVIGLLNNSEVKKIIEEYAEKGKSAAVDLVVDVLPLPLPKSILKQVSRGVVDVAVDFIKAEKTLPTVKTLQVKADAKR